MFGFIAIIAACIAVIILGVFSAILAYMDKKRMDAYLNAKALKEYLDVIVMNIVRQTGGRDADSEVAPQIAALAGRYRDLKKNKHSLERIPLFNSIAALYNSLEPSPTPPDSAAGIDDADCEPDEWGEPEEPDSPRVKPAGAWDVLDGAMVSRSSRDDPGGTLDKPKYEPQTVDLLRVVYNDYVIYLNKLLDSRPLAFAGKLIRMKKLEKLCSLKGLPMQETE